MSGLRWLTSWPAIIAGFLLYAVPGAILLAMRKGVRLRTKLIALAVSPVVAIIMVAAGVGGDDAAPSASATAPAPAATAAASVSPAPSPSASASASASAAPSPGVSPSAMPSAVATPAPSEDASEAPAVAGSAEAAAHELTVKGRAPKTGYARDQFGDGWIDVDRNGCDTRNDMLRLRLTNLDTQGSCTVLAGTLADPYTATQIRFVKGGASEVDIDHMVALSDAWQKGAATWDYAQRVALANDPLNLEPVDAGANRQKGDGDAATWLPANKDYRCHYVARQVAVKAKYGLWVTQAELDAILRVLSACPGEPLPEPGDQPIIAVNAGGAPPSAQDTPDPKPVKTSAPVSDTDPDLGTCKAAKAAGYGPYVKGTDPEYDWYRDADKDGTVCE